MNVLRYFYKLRSVANNRLTDEDVKFLRENLTKQEQILFYSMAMLDQRHSLSTAYSVREIVGRKSKINADKLIKTALLHDIGKARARLRLADRAAQVLVFFSVRPLANYLADKGALRNAGYWRRILYIYKYHPLLGANLLRDIGASGGVVYLVEHHHDAFQEKEAKELTILREADELN